MKFETQTQAPSTEKQIRAANIATFLSVAEKAKHVANERTRREGLLGKTARKEARRRRGIYTDFGLIDAGLMDRSRVDEKYGKETLIYSADMLEEQAGIIEEQRAMEKIAGSLTKLERTKIWSKASLKAGKLTPHQNASLIALVGEDTASEIDRVQKLTKAGALSGISGAIATGVIAVGSAFETIHPLVHLAPITDPKTLAIIGGSYLGHYGALAATTASNKKLIDSKINYCANIWATGLHYLSDKIKAGSEGAKYMAVAAGTYAPAVSQELALIPTLAATPQILFARNVIGAAYNVGLTTINRIVEKRSKKV